MTPFIIFGSLYSVFKKQCPSIYRGEIACFGQNGEMATGLKLAKSLERKEIKNFKNLDF